MTARPAPLVDDDQDEPDGMAVAAWAAIVMIVLLWLAAAVGWLALMHRAGTGRGLW